MRFWLYDSLDLFVVLIPNRPKQARAIRDVERFVEVSTSELGGPRISQCLLRYCSQVFGQAALCRHFLGTYITVRKPAFHFLDGKNHAVGHWI